MSIYEKYGFITNEDYWSKSVYEIHLNQIYYNLFVPCKFTSQAVFTLHSIGKEEFNKRDFNSFTEVLIYLKILKRTRLK